MILAPSASLSMASTVLGDTDMTLMRAYFVKPPSAVAMSFSDDPQMGLQCDRFTGSATATLTTTSFVVRTASLH
ncbi:MAG: ATP-binding protein, partial [Bradyrhizobium sp.]